MHVRSGAGALIYVFKVAVLGFAAVLVAGIALGAGDESAEPKRSIAPQGAAVVCGGGGLDATVALAYDFVTIGPISATYVTVGFEPPLTLPRAAKEIRSRLKGLLAQGTRVGPPRLAGKRLRVALATTEQGIQPGKVFKVRFDCPAGSRINPSAFSCATSEVTSASGEPLQEMLARDVRCLIEVDPVGR